MTLAVEKWVDQGVRGDMDKVWRSTLKEEESKRGKTGGGAKLRSVFGTCTRVGGLSVELEASPRERAVS